MKTGENVETSVFGPLGILVALVKRKIGKVYPKSGIFACRPSTSTFLVINFSVSIET